ncbi:MAG: P1 family peptidase [Eubacterium sp.]|nr:P1 family peptidase [Eubacterium sp.]
MRKEISITDIKGIHIGQTENVEAATGLTVIISEQGMGAGLDIRGGGPASRDSGLLDPLTAAEVVHAVVLGGGSAFGLGASNGVMEYLEKRGIGFDVGVTKVPLVVQSDIFDLTVGDKDVRPDPAMGYEAAKNAMESPNYKDGNYGAGCGATVGKISGMDTCMKTGIGSYAIEIGPLQIGAIVVVNSLGDIYDWRKGKKIAGLLAEDRKGFRDTVTLMEGSIDVRENKFVDNTTIGAIITNAKFTKSQLCKIAGMTHNGFARSIRPVHTTADGDSIYALSTGDVNADMDLVGTLAAEVMSEAITRAVYSAKSAYGFPSANEITED